MAKAKPKKRCLSCDRWARRGRAWCKRCLKRIYDTGCVEIEADYPTQNDWKRLRTSALG